MINEQNIKYEKGNHWVLQVSKGFEVYRNEITHSVRVGIIGFEGEKGLNKAIQICNDKELAI